MSTTTISGIGHIALSTADLDRFRRFYEDLLGLRMTVIMRLPVEPFHRHALFHIDQGLALHVFEVPGYDPQAQGIGTDIGERGRIDHFAFVVEDRAALEAITARLRAAGASDGEVRSLGPILSIHVTDPDGLELEVTALDPDFDPDRDPTEVVEEQIVPQWWQLLAARSAVATA